MAQVGFLSYELSLFLVLFSAVRGFSLGIPVIPTVANFNLMWNTQSSDFYFPGNCSPGKGCC